MSGVPGALAALFVIVALDGAPAQPPPPAPAPPAPLPIDSSWDAPPECPTAAEFEAEVRRLAGPVPPPALRPEARATVRRAPGDRWQLTLATKTGALAGERKLSAASCPELMQAAALVVALMINPAAGASPSPLPPPPPPPAPPAPLPPPARRFTVGAALSVGLGALPGPAVGVGGRATAGGPHLAALLRGNVWGERRAASPADASAGGTFDLLDVGAGACARGQPLEAVWLGLCGGATLLWSRGAGYGVTNPGQATSLWGAAFFGPEARVLVTRRSGLHLEIETLVPAARPTFRLAGVGTVYEPAAIAWRASAGWEVHF